MDALYQSPWFWTILILSLIFLWYLRPFFLSSFFKTSLSLWGYRLGMNKKKSLLEMSPSSDLQKVKDDLREIISEELDHMDERLTRERERLEKKVDDYANKIEKSQERHKERKETIAESSPIKTYNSVKENIAEAKNIKGFVLTLVTIGILLLDTKVASDIFKSFGAFLGSVAILGYTAENTIVYGFLFTTALAVFLHITLAKTNIEDVFGKGIRGSLTFGAVFGILTILVVFGLRTFMLAAPDSAQLLSELLLLVIWIVCILIVCFISKYVGQNDKWTSAIGYPALFVLLVIFGGITLIGYLGEFLFSFLIERKLMVQKSRAEKLLDINETSKEAQKGAFVRGVTS